MDSNHKLQILNYEQTDVTLLLEKMGIQDDQVTIVVNLEGDAYSSEDT